MARRAAGRSALMRWLAAIMIVLAMALPAAAKPFRIIVTEADVPLLPNSVLQLAASLGYFKRAGVDVEIVRVQQTPAALAALRAGEGDMANLATEAVLRMVAGNAMHLKAVISSQKALPYIIAASSDVTGPKNLEGRNFAIGKPGSLDHSLTMQVLGAIGVDPEAVRFVALGMPQARAAALASGTVDATTVSLGTWTAMPNKSGLKILLDQQSFFKAAPVVGKVNVVTDETMLERREDVGRVVRALILASRDFAKGDGWVDAMAERHPEMTRDDLRFLADAFRDDWSVNGGLNRQELQRTQERIFADPQFEGLPAPALDEWVDFGPIDSALKLDGVAPGADRPVR
jgi:NitT/TauT family transport system substrate-binding protein